MIKIIIKYKILEGFIRFRKEEEEEAIGGHLGFRYCFLYERLRTRFSTPLVAPGWKPSGDLVRLGEYPSPLGEFIQNSQEILTVAVWFSFDGKYVQHWSRSFRPVLSQLSQLFLLFQRVKPPFIHYNKS